MDVTTGGACLNTGHRHEAACPAMATQGATPERGAKNSRQHLPEALATMRATDRPACAVEGIPPATLARDGQGPTHPQEGEHREVLSHMPRDLGRRSASRPSEPMMANPSLVTGARSRASFAPDRPMTTSVPRNTSPHLRSGPSSRRIILKLWLPLTAPPANPQSHPGHGLWFCSRRPAPANFRSHF